MEFISWNNELGLANLVFMRCFNNIQIERRDSSGNTTWLKVPCVMSTRSRVIKNLENEMKRGTWKLPMICINRSGYSRAGDRLNNLHNEVKHEITEKNRDYQKLTPVPIDISYEVTVVAKYPGDIDKIASNFLVFLNSNIYGSIEHPKFKGQKLNNQIVLGDSVSEEHPDEFDGSQDDIIMSTFSFTFKTYLFGGRTKYKKIETVQQEVSSYTVAVTSSYIAELDASEIDEYQKKYPDNSVTAEIGPDSIDGFQQLCPDGKVSAVLTCQVLSDVTEYAEVSTDVDQYEGVPLIYKLDFGFYAVPRNEDHEAYMESVDNGLIAVHENSPICAYISSDQYIKTETGLSSVGDHYAQVDTYCSLEPFVDRIRWRIDDASEQEFPANVQTFRTDSDFL